MNRVLCEPTFSFLLGKSPGTGMYGKYTFNFIKNCQTVFQSSCTIYSPPTMHERSSPHTLASIW